MFKIDFTLDMVIVICHSMFGKNWTNGVLDKYLMKTVFLINIIVFIKSISEYINILYKMAKNT